MQTSIHSKSQGVGQELVLLHGWGVNSGVWLSLSEKLSQNYKVTLIDLPGFGRSHHCMPQNYDLPSVAAMVAERVSPDSILVGWSLGGLVAQQIALSHAIELRGMMLVASSPKFMAEEGWLGIQPQVLQTFQTQLKENYSVTLERFLAIQAMGSESPKSDIKAIKNSIEQFPSPCVEALSGGLQILADADLRSQLQDIKIPTMRLYGRLDSLVPAKSIDRIQALQPKATCQIMNKSSHAPFISHSSLFIEQLRAWLETLDEVSL